VLVGGHGGRLDHLLGNLLLLGGLAASAGARIEARMGAARVYVVSPGREVVIDASDGELVSLLAMHGDAAGIETDGLRWALHGETLAAGSTRGVSNELAGPTARISVRAGVLLVVQPGTR
jgi:thiamine pyrophosphokinase